MKDATPEQIVGFLTGGQAMSDIVKQLRFKAGMHLPVIDTMAEAADEIERLREENDIMRRHLNLHPDKPLGNELRDEIERLRARNADLEEQILHALGERPQPRKR